VTQPRSPIFKLEHLHQGTCITAENLAVVCRGSGILPLARCHMSSFMGLVFVPPNKCTQPRHGSNNRRLCDIRSQSMLFFKYIYSKNASVQMQ